jgi:TRAP-type C4-dicarboxylate transport system permease small subunit
MKTVSEIARRLARVMYVIAGIALASSMFLTVADVILRTFKRPIVGTYELVGLLGAVTIGFAIPETSRVKGHVLMDFVTSRLPSLLRRLFLVLTRFLGILIFAIIGWNLWGLGNDLRRAGEVSATLQLPFYPIAYSIAVCCLVECLVLFLDILERKDAQE